MYANDTMIHVHAMTGQKAACMFYLMMVHVTQWLNNCYLHLNVKETVCVLFTMIVYKISKLTNVVICIV